jgi:hypothetical protein
VQPVALYLPNCVLLAQLFGVYLCNWLHYICPIALCISAQLCSKSMQSVVLSAQPLALKVSAQPLALKVRVSAKLVARHLPNRLHYLRNHLFYICETGCSISAQPVALSAQLLVVHLRNWLLYIYATTCSTFAQPVALSAQPLDLHLPEWLFCI